MAKAFMNDLKRELTIALDLNNDGKPTVKVGTRQAAKFIRLQRKISIGAPLTEGKMKDKAFQIAMYALYDVPIVSKNGRQKAEEKLAGLAEKIVNNSAKATGTYQLLDGEKRDYLAKQLMNLDGNGFGTSNAGRVHDEDMFQRRWVWGFGTLMTALTAILSGPEYAIAPAGLTLCVKYCSNIARRWKLFGVAEEMQDFVAEKLSEKAVA